MIASDRGRAGGRRLRAGLAGRAPSSPVRLDLSRRTGTAP